MFNGVRCLACQTLLCLFLFEYKRMSETYVANPQSRYNDLVLSWFSEIWSPFSQSGLYLEEFVVNVIPVLLPFCKKELSLNDFYKKKVENFSWNAQNSKIGSEKKKCSNHLTKKVLCLLKTLVPARDHLMLRSGIYITIYIYFLDGRFCEVGAVRRGIRIVCLWGLDSPM